jgi:hypothetical protein
MVLTKDAGGVGLLIGPRLLVANDLHEALEGRATLRQAVIVRKHTFPNELRAAPETRS